MSGHSVQTKGDNRKVISEELQLTFASEELQLTLLKVRRDSEEVLHSYLQGLIQGGLDRVASHPAFQMKKNKESGFSSNFILN